MLLRGSKIKIEKQDNLHDDESQKRQRFPMPKNHHTRTRRFRARDKRHHNKNSIKSYLWSNVGSDLIGHIQIDSVSKYSTTDAKTATEQTIIIKAFSFPNSVITDGTACVGGNAVSFARSFFKVNVVEINLERFTMLQNNCSVLGLRDKIKFVNDDYIKIHQNLKQDIVFLDPPWGGKGYKMEDVVQLSLSGVPIHQLCSQIRKANRNVKVIGLKVPFNYSRREILEVGKCIGANVCSYDFGKQVLIILDFKRGPG